MDETSGQGRATLVRNGVEFDERDVSLLKEIDETGSVAKASSNLGRSRARDLSRIEALESAFGDLVERSRGGSDGGGSRLTEHALGLVNQYERLQVVLSATARVPETVLEGSVEAVTGELATVTTAVGTVRGLHDGVEPGDNVQIRVAADSITVLEPSADLAPGSTSARNRLSGTIDRLDRGKTVLTVHIDVDTVVFCALVTEESADHLQMADGRDVVITWKATATWLAHER